MSKTALEVAETLYNGDVVRVTRTVRVASAVTDGTFDAIDVQSGDLYFIRAAGSVRIEVIKKAPRDRSSDFSVGDTITADALREVRWAPGTVIDSLRYPGDVYVLHEDGKWHDLPPGWDMSFTSEEFAGDWKIVRRP